MDDIEFGFMLIIVIGIFSLGFASGYLVCYDSVNHDFKANYEDGFHAGEMLCSETQFIVLNNDTDLRCAFIDINRTLFYRDYINKTFMDSGYVCERRP